MSKAPALLLFAAASLLLARGITPEDYLRFEFVGNPAISPDGKSVAFPLTKINEKLNRRMMAIWLVPYDGSAAPRPLTAETVSSSNPQWSPEAGRVGGLGQSVRLPGFRPGKIPAAVLEQRYGAKVQSSLVSRLAAEAADSLMLHGGDAGHLEFRVAVTHLPDLPPVDFAELELERLTAPENGVRSLEISDADAAEIFQDHLRQQVLDFLNSVYEFPLAPALAIANSRRFGIRPRRSFRRRRTARRSRLSFAGLRNGG